MEIYIFFTVVYDIVRARAEMRLTRSTREAGEQLRARQATTSGNNRANIEYSCRQLKPNDKSKVDVACDSPLWE